MDEARILLGSIYLNSRLMNKFKNGDVFSFKVLSASTASTVP